MGPWGKVRSHSRFSGVSCLCVQSAAIPAIVGVFGLLFRKDAAGNETLPPFARTWLILPALAVLSFLISILAGVVYSYYLCKKTDRLEDVAHQLQRLLVFLVVVFVALPLIGRGKLRKGVYRHRESQRR